MHLVLAQSMGQRWFVASSALFWFGVVLLVIAVTRGILLARGSRTGSRPGVTRSPRRPTPPRSA